VTLVRKCLDWVEATVASIGIITIAIAVIFLGESLPEFFGLSFRQPPPLHDRALLHMDLLLTGTHPSFLIGRWLLPHPLLMSTLTAVYLVLPPVLALLTTLSFCHPDTLCPAEALLYVGGPALAGGFCYLLCPAVGPAFLWRFPYGDPGPLRVTTMACPPGVPFNASPSMHAAWAMLLVIATRRFAWPMRVLTLAYSLLTLLATMALGEHYLVDLLAAIPVVAMFWNVTRRSYPAASLCASLVLAWQLFIRFQ